MVVNAYVDQMKVDRYMCSPFERKEKDISSTQLSKGHTWDRFKLNKAKIPDFQSFDFFFCSLVVVFIV